MPPAARKPAVSRQRAGRPKATTKNGSAPEQTGTITIPNQMLKMPASTEHEITLAPSDIPHFYSTPTEPDENNPYDEREPVFFFDDKEYTAPVVVPASFGLKFVEMRLLYGVDSAVVYAIQTTLGMEGWNALTSIPKLHPDQLDGIIGKLVMKLVNATTAPKGQ